MALSNEWQYQHLTPNGWVQGSERVDFQGVTKREAPSDAVLTAYREVYVGAGATPNITEDRTPHTDDKDLIDRLLVKYGAPQFGV